MTQSTTKRFGASSFKVAGPLEHLKRPDPGIELLLRKLSFQRADAAAPKGRFHEASVSRESSEVQTGKWVAESIPGSRATEGCSGCTLRAQGLALPAFFRASRP